MIITVDNICTTSAIISLNVSNHPACGAVSHNAYIMLNESGTLTALLPLTVNNSIYKFIGLSNDTVYNIRVVLSFNNNANRNFLKSVKTLATKCKFEFYTYS